tara:strand:- start:619 stop:1122 length:504 start_codon:yes stop_codon:yes gene_type:complete
VKKEKKMENHSQFKINYTIDSDPDDLFSAITKGCFFLENHDDFKQRVFLKMQDLFVDLEDNTVSSEILDIIGQILDNVRILVIDNVDSTVIGGGCHPDKCKHRILLEKKNTMFTVLSASDSDKYHLDKCLRKGVYKYRSYLCCKISIFAACAGTIIIYLLSLQTDLY